MSERRGTKALETWCRRLTEGYPGVKVENMTTSWRDGLAFCAIIHHFRPDLIDFASLNPTNVYYNNSLAFTVAERQLGIPALLDAEDMVMYSVPDRLSILTYLSQFYQVFGNQTTAAAGAKQGTSQRIVPKRTALSSEMGMLSSASSSPPTKMSRSTAPLTGIRREPCFKCSFPVFLAERLNVGTKLYHRTCFRCARCNNQLSLANYYETETEGQYCCETCPDEEDPPKMAAFDSLDNVKNIDTDKNTSVRNRSLSDEEKSKGLVDGYSQDFELTLEDKSQVSKARNHFLSAHLLNEDPVNSKDVKLQLKGANSTISKSRAELESLNCPEHKSQEDVSKSTEDGLKSDATLENLLRSLTPQQLKGVNSTISQSRDGSNTAELDNLGSRENINCPEHKLLEGPDCPKPVESLNSVETHSTNLRNSTNDLFSSQKDLSNASKNPSTDLTKDRLQFASKVTQQDVQTSRTDLVSSTDRRNSTNDLFRSRKDLSNSSKDLSSPSKDRLQFASKVTQQDVQISGTDVVSSTDLRNSTNDLFRSRKDLSNSSKDLSSPSKDRLQFASKVTQQDVQISGTDLVSSTDRRNSTKDLFRSRKDLSNSSKDLSSPSKDRLQFASKVTQQDVQISDTKQTENNFSDTKPSDKHLSDVPPDLTTQEDTKDVPPPLPDSKPPDVSTDCRNDLLDNHLDNQVDKQIDNQEDIPPDIKTSLATTSANNLADGKVFSDLKASLATSEAPNARTVNNFVNKPPQKEDPRRSASEETLEEKTKETTQSLVKKRMLIFETGSKNKINEVPLQDNNTSEALYESVSSEDLDVKYKTVRSDVADSLVLYSSTLSDEPPLLDKQHILTKSIIEDLSDQSSVPINASLLEDSPEDLKQVHILTKSIIEDLSDQSSVPINASLLEDSQYPEDLNPFGDELEDLKKTNPLRIEELKRIKPSMEDLTIITPPTKEEKRHSTNPFGSSDEEESEPFVKQKPPRPPQPAVRNEGRKVVEAPKVNLNPFWSDDEEPDEDVKEKPVPLPRSKHITTPEPRPRKPDLSNTASHYDSNSSLSSINSSIGLTPGRKKKPAPAPPPQGLTPEGSKSNSPTTSTHPSPKLTPRIRKNRKAPLPPSSTPFVTSYHVGDNCDISPITHDKLNQQSIVEPIILSPVGSDIEKEKNNKDEKNRNRQSQSIPSPVLSDSDSLSISQQCSSSDKSTHGKWKRKKGPAPARPVPQRRQIRPLPLVELRRELDIIEMQQQGLEKQGVKLEQLIREKCEVPGNNDDTALDPEVEDLVLELFELVNEKNELFRRQAELMYLRRQQRLEEEHADLEYQIRCLMERPERNKTDSDKAREEELINRLLEVVERRNEIVECLEMDRVREAEEDQSINSRLSQLASKKDEPVIETPVKLSKKEKKKMKKEKKLKEKGKNLDVDKDIDESETSSVGKEKKKKKWF